MVNQCLVLLLSLIKRRFSDLVKNSFHIYAKQSKEKGKRKNTHFFYTSSQLDQQITRFQQPANSPLDFNLAFARPTIPLDFVIASHCWTLQKKGLWCNCIDDRFSPQKRESTQELNLSLLSKVITSFESTIQKWVTLTERVKAKTKISQLEI